MDLQVKILNTRAKRIIDDLAALKLIVVKEEEELFKLLPKHKKSIEVSRKQILEGDFKSNKQVLDQARKWVKRK